MAKHSYGATLLTDWDDKKVKETLDKEALIDLEKHSKPPKLALTQVTMDLVEGMEAGTIFTLTDAFLLIHEQGHTDAKIKSLQTVLSRLVKNKEFPLMGVKIAGRQRGYQKT